MSNHKPCDRQDDSKVRQPKKMKENNTRATHIEHNSNHPEYHSSAFGNHPQHSCIVMVRLHTFNHLKLLVRSKWRFYKQMGLLNNTVCSCSWERELCRCSHIGWMKCTAHWLINHVVLIQLLMFSGKCCTGSFFNTDFRFVCQGSERT